MSSELLPAFLATIETTNDQRHDAALTIVERTNGALELADILLLVGLAEVGEDGRLRAAGVDEWEMSWFTPAASRPAAR